MYYGQLIEEVLELKKKVNNVYIYGAGLRGKEIYYILLRNEIQVNGFIVTEKMNKEELLGLPIMLADTIIHEKAGIVIGLSDTYAEQVKSYLKEKNIPKEYIVDGGKYITQDRGSNDLMNNPTLEITTVIGCSINCKYCPQKLLLSKYFSVDKRREHVMSLENFKKFLENTPNNCDIMFAGMAEPYLNADCTKMLKLACSAGRNVSLYTTLAGASDEDIDAMLELPIQFVELHVADEHGYAQIEESEEYYRKVERILAAKKADGSPFVNDIGAQANPTDRIMEMCKGKYEPLISNMDRAGNLNDDNLTSRDRYLDGEIMKCCMGGLEFNNHVVMPDGTVLLCNMDYGMQHVLGNLLENTFDEIHNGEIMQKIMRNIKGNSSDALLCRKCIFAVAKRD